VVAERLQQQRRAGHGGPGTPGRRGSPRRPGPGRGTPIRSRAGIRAPTIPDQRARQRRAGSTASPRHPVADSRRAGPAASRTVPGERPPSGHAGRPRLSPVQRAPGSPGPRVGFSPTRPHSLAGMRDWSRRRVRLALRGPVPGPAATAARRRAASGRSRRSNDPDPMGCAPEGSSAARWSTVVPSYRQRWWCGPRRDEARRAELLRQG